MIISGKPTDFYIMSLEDVCSGVKRTKWADLVTPDIIKYFLTMNNPEEFYLCDKRDNSVYRLIDLKEV